MKLSKRNPLVLYLLNKYISYALLFFRGLILAKFLGPYYFGIWGFISLTLQYLSYTSLGINYAVTVKLSIDEKRNTLDGSYVSNAIISTILFSALFIIVAITIKVTDIDLFPKYDFLNYLVVVSLITIFANLQQVLINILRVYKKLLPIAIVECVSAIILASSALIFRDNQLINFQLHTMLVVDVIGSIFLLIMSPVKLQFRLNKKIVVDMLKLGIPLLIYNLSFYLISISVRTVVSANYSVEILGYFTLANSISNATLLGLQSVAWAVYPEVLAKFSTSNDINAVQNRINLVNTFYNLSCFLSIFLIIALLPLVFIFLPKYLSSMPIINVMLISQAILLSSYGYNALAVSRKKQNEVAKIGIFTVVFVTIGSVLVAYQKVNYFWITVIALIGSVFYTIMQIKLGTQLLQKKESLVTSISKFLPANLIFAIIIIIIGGFYKSSYIFSIIGILLLVVPSISKFKEFFDFIKKNLLAVESTEE